MLLHLVLTYYLLGRLAARRVLSEAGLENRSLVLWLVPECAGSCPLLLPLVGAAGASALPSLGPDSPGDALCRFDAPELKAANHRLDGVFWPRSAETGTPEQPVVLLEVQMHAKPGFKHRLFAQTARFLQLHPQVQHLAVVVVVPHRRLNSKHDAATPSSDRWLTLTEWKGPSDLERNR